MGNVILTLIELFHKIMVPSVLRERFLQMRMRSHPVGLDV